MHWKNLYLMIPLISISSLYAILEKKIDEKKTIEVVFSKSSHNRISVDGSAVEEIFGDESIFQITIDRTSGNAFINILQDIGEKCTTLTVVTGSGFIQDLSVKSHDGPSEHVILKEEEEEDIEHVLSNSDLVPAATIDLLNKILEGKVPLGYGQKKVENNEKLSLPDPIQAHPIKALEGPFETIVVFRIKNNGKRSVVITADSIKQETNSWVFLNCQELKSKEETLCVMSYPKTRR